MTLARDAGIDIAELIRMYSSSPTDDLHELWRRIVFNVLISNLDDHLRNHAFLHDRDGKWRLSPAYDLNPVPTKKQAAPIADQLTYDVRCRLWRASVALAFKDMKAARRNMDLIDKDALSEFPRYRAISTKTQTEQ